jgi:hypothetical protein
LILTGASSRYVVLAIKAPSRQLRQVPPAQGNVHSEIQEGRCMMGFRLTLLGCLVAAPLSVTCGFALAQTGNAENPANTSMEPSARQEPPPGGCMPIGVTVSGDIVFPFQCKEFIEQKKAVNSKPVAIEEQAKPTEKQTSTPEQAPAVADQQTPPNQPILADQPTTASQKASSQSSENVQPENLTTSAIGEPSAEPRAVPEAAEKAQPKRRDRKQSSGPANCTHYRTYSAETGTYRDYQGRRRPCQS